ncbi:MULTISPECIES: VWD domain-containing protein [unclassified Calothrix]|uniref:VWD domain-containing protein n=1 Tax=unclassified Calothrix TaxID=2619626 RepID=UPI001F5589AA|nr:MULTISPECIES: VWD domain-containing protein [unclassified Calothrix]
MQVVDNRVGSETQFYNLQLDVPSELAQIPRVRQQTPQPSNVPNNNSPEVLPQNSSQDSLKSPIQTQASKSDSPCQDKVNGFSLYQSANGVCLYSQESSYITTVDLSKAKLFNLTGPITKKNTIEAKNPDYFLNEHNEIENLNRQGLKLRAMVNGTFFSTIDGKSDVTIGNILQAGERIIPLGLRTEGKIIQEYNPQKIDSNFAHRAFCFDSTTASIQDNVAQAFQDTSKCPNFIGLYAPTAPKPPDEKPILGGRTFVGIRNSNAQGSTVLFFSSNSATLKQARDTLTSFGATSIAQLDGAGSLLLTWGQDILLKGDRFKIWIGIPSAIAIYSKEPEEKPQDRTGKPVKGTSYGDPHLITFDGHRYSFQTVGEFILAKSTDGIFEVQTRQSAVNKSLSLNSAVAMKVGKNRVAFYSKDFPDANTNTPLRINGKPTVVEGDSLSLPGGGVIHKQNDSNYVVEWSTGEKVAITIYSRGQFKYMDVFPFVLESQANQMVGLLGNVNGNVDDDLRFRSGDILPSKSTYGDVRQLIERVSPIRIPLGELEKIYLDKLNKDFGNSWRVSQKESLFDYGQAQSTATFTDKAFPDAYLTLDMLSPAQLEDARSQCLNARVDASLLDGCIFDVGFTGYSEFAYRAAQVSNILNVVESVIPGFKNPIPGILRQVPKIPGL